MHNPDGVAAVLDETLIQYRCALPPGATVLVQRGTRVDADDIVATLRRPGRHLVIDVAQRLGIAPQRLKHALRAELGRRLAGGSILARGPGLFNRLLMPLAGTINAIDESSGCVVISSDSVDDQIRAGVRGVVMAVDRERGIMIETPAAQLYLAAAFINATNGVIRLMTDQPYDSIHAEDIDERANGAILVGATIDGAGLQRAEQVGAAGILVGGVSAADISSWLQVSSSAAWRPLLQGTATPELARRPPLTLMLTEGFGAKHMHPTAFAVLQRYDRQPLLIDQPDSGNVSHADRVIIPLSNDRPVHLHPAHPRLRVGSQVRLLSAPYYGHTAIVRELHPGGTSTQGATRCISAEVATQDGRLLIVAATALEPLA